MNNGVKSRTFYWILGILIVTLTSVISFQWIQVLANDDKREKGDRVIQQAITQELKEIRQAQAEESKQIREEQYTQAQATQKQISNMGQSLFVAITRLETKMDK